MNERIKKRENPESMCFSRTWNLFINTLKRDLQGREVIKNEWTAAVSI